MGACCERNRNTENLTYRNNVEEKEHIISEPNESVEEIIKMEDKFLIEKEIAINVDIPLRKCCGKPGENSNSRALDNIKLKDPSNTHRINNNNLFLTIMEGILTPVGVNVRRKKGTKNLGKIYSLKEKKPNINLNNLNSELNSTHNESKNLTPENTSYLLDDHSRSIPKKELLNVKLNEHQVTLILNTLTGVGLVTAEMDLETLKEIIEIIKYYKIEKNIDILYDDNRNNSYLYIVASGKVLNSKSGKEKIMIQGECFSEHELGNNINSVENATAIELAFVFRIQIEVYRTILSNFNLKIRNEKYNCISSMAIFRNLDQSKINDLSKDLVKRIYIDIEKDNQVILEEGQMTDRIFIIASGFVTCSKNNTITKKLSVNDYFGDIALFCNMCSYFTYRAEGNVGIFELKFDTIAEVVGDNYVKDIIFNCFYGSIKKSEHFSNHLAKNSFNNFFNLFCLKYYFKDIVCSSTEKKICIVISGRLMKRNFEIVAVGGDLFGESVIDEMEGLDNILSEDECVIFEASWAELLKSIKLNCSNGVSVYDKVTIMQNIPVFNSLSEWKLFRLAQLLKIENYKNNEVIIKEGPVSSKFCIIKSGKVKVFINNIMIKELEKNNYFGEISAMASYSKPATFIANGKVECFVLAKEIFDEIVDSSKYTPLENIMVLRDITITLESLFFVKDLGFGSYGKVFQVHNGKNFYAVKMAEIKICQKNNLFRYFINEKNLMMSMDHPFVVKLVNTFKTKEHILFLMEYIDGITLRNFMDRRNISKTRDLYEAQFYGAMLLLICSYLQRIRVIHRDIKPSNCMIEKSGYLKLIDFGVAKDMTLKDHTSTLVGTAHYMSPEMILGKNYSFSSDFWSIGVVIYEIFYGCLPFGNNSMALYEIYDEITEKKLHLPPDKKYGEINNFLKFILHKDPNKRISNLTQAKCHPFFRNFNFEALLNKSINPPQIFQKLLQQFCGIKREDPFVNSTFPFDNFIENEYYSKKENDHYSSKSLGNFDWLEEF